MKKDPDRFGTGFGVGFLIFALVAAAALSLYTGLLS